MHATPTLAAPRPSRRPATVEDWLAIPEEQRAQLIQGKIIYDAFPGPRHGFTQIGVTRHIGVYSRRSGGGGAPAGWWLGAEVDMVISDIGCRPDTSGWRRDKHTRMPEPDERGVVTVVPEFICEVLSSSTARYDQGPKRDAYFHAGVMHYWLVDPTYKTLTVLERGERGYVILLVGSPGDVVRAPPFELVEIPVAELFLDEEDASAAKDDAPGEPSG